MPERAIMEAAEEPDATEEPEEADVDDEEPG
jgi:hypothetical protein